MKTTLTINGISHELEIHPSGTLLAILRGLGFHSVEFGDEHGLTGADTVMLDGRPVNAGLLLAAQAEGHKIATLMDEAVSRAHMGSDPQHQLRLYRRIDRQIQAKNSHRQANPRGG